MCVWWVPMKRGIDEVAVDHYLVCHSMQLGLVWSSFQFKSFRGATFQESS